VSLQLARRSPLRVVGLWAYREHCIEIAVSPRPIQRTVSIRSHTILGGLHHHYIRVRFSVETRTGSAILAANWALRLAGPSDRGSVEHLGERAPSIAQTSRSCGSLPWGEGDAEDICCIGVGCVGVRGTGRSSRCGGRSDWLLPTRLEDDHGRLFAAARHLLPRLQLLLLGQH
jgi:hypothetical protein